MPCSTDNEITSTGVTHLRPKPFGFPFLFSNSNGRIQVVIWATTQQNPTEPKTPAIAAHQQPRCVLLRHFAVPVAPWLLVWPIQWSPGNDCRWDRPISKVCLASHGPLHQAHERMGRIWIYAVPQKTSALTSEGFQTQANLSTACHSYRWPIFTCGIFSKILPNIPIFHFSRVRFGQFRIPCHGQARRSLRHLDDGRAWRGAGGDLFHPTAPWRSAKVVAICRAQVLGTMWIKQGHKPQKWPWFMTLFYPHYSKSHGGLVVAKSFCGLGFAAKVAAPEVYGSPAFLCRLGLPSSQASSRPGWKTSAFQIFSDTRSPQDASWFADEVYWSLSWSIRRRSKWLQRCVSVELDVFQGRSLGTCSPSSLPFSDGFGWSLA